MADPARDEASPTTVQAMGRQRGRVVRVDSLADFDRRIALGASNLSGWHLQALDLSERREAVRSVQVGGALFLGCRFGDGDEESVRARGAVVFPHLPDAPIDAYRAGLYSARELYDVPRYGGTLDARAHAWASQWSDRETRLAQTLHDHAIDEALTGWVDGRDLVGVMGGHALRRGEPDYRSAARLGRILGANYTVATGGGPGAMEAANLGAYLSGESSDVLDQALALLARVPCYRPDRGAWAAAAFDAIDRWPSGTDTLGIPTWHYGHEPPNVFATAIAKYFRNATREAILLQVCESGIVFLPGAAGTVQEIFQDACENYYADVSSLAPMVLVGREHWKRRLPAWPLLEQLARDRPMASVVHLVDSLEEAADALAG